MVEELKHVVATSLDEVTDEYRKKFVADFNNQPLTRSLFHEFKVTSPDASEKGPYYTLKEYDYKGYPSARRIYLSLEDPTEYMPAMLLLGSYRHWKYLCGLFFFKDHIAEWREELEIKMRARGVRGIIKLAEKGDGNSFAAVKWLAEKGWVDAKGRPSKQKIEAEASKIARIHEEIDEDVSRMHEILSGARH